MVGPSAFAGSRLISNIVKEKQMSLPIGFSNFIEKNSKYFFVIIQYTRIVADYPFDK
jgi:hypothetical protein